VFLILELISLKFAIMKRKIFVGVLGGLLATFSILSVNTSLTNTGDISLKNIAVMARANAEDNPVNPCPESGNGCFANGLWYAYLRPHV
jgi:hypothetical protein